VKIIKFDYIRLNIFCRTKRTINARKGNMLNRRKYLQIMYLMKYIRNSHNAITNKLNNSVERWTNNLRRYFFLIKTHEQLKGMWKSTQQCYWFTFKGNVIQNQNEYQLTVLGIVMIKKTNHNRAGWRHRNRETWYPLGGSGNCIAITENDMELPKKH
jgi:hypothetical protein